jgi:hypothetical protein
VKKAIVYAVSIFMLAAALAWGADARAWKPFSDDNDLWGFKDEMGQVVILPRFNMAFDFNKHGAAAVVDGSNWYYINTQGHVLLQTYTFDNGPDYYEEGLARYVDGDRIGFINEAAQVVIPAAYDFAFPFTEGRARVCRGCKIVREESDEHSTVKGGWWGYIDRKGDVVVPLIYEWAGFFEGGRGTVIKGGERMEVDLKGRIHHAE